MAGYVLKIVIEDTHPPVWRRIVIPERATFAELHEMIQIIFGWSDSHLHEFFIPSESIRIGNDEDAYLYNYFKESETLVENFFPEHKWVRYIYDFGDEWRHKIIYEKTDETYNERYASLLKVKGDNFMEDCGGVWDEEEDGWNRCVFDSEQTAERLRKLICPVHEELLEDMYEQSKPDRKEKLNRMIENLLRGFQTDQFGTTADVPSPMARKINAWRDFLERRDQDEEEEPECDFTQLSLPFVSEEDLKILKNTVKIVPGAKTQEKLLCDLGMQEARDYCKYLQIPVENFTTKEQMVKETAHMLQEHPDYILYIFQDAQYQEFLRMWKQSCGTVRDLPEDEDVLTKAMSIGLADITVQKSKNGSRAELSFAKDLPEIIKPLTANLRKQTFRKLSKFSKKLGSLVLVYGLLDLDSLYGMFQKIYGETLSREEVFRCTYWHARMNDMIDTVYDQEGNNYVCAQELDAEVILKNRMKYAADLDYVMFPAKEIKKMAENIGERSDWLGILFATLHFEFGFPEDMSADLLEEMFTVAMNGYPITEVLDVAYALLPEDASLEGICELWQCATGLMLELGLPMLKGRSRNQYEEETGVSSWKMGMLEEPRETGVAKDTGGCGHSKEDHIWEFSGEIQEAMYYASGFASQDHMKQLWEYQEKEQVKSEEFLCLLAAAYVIGCDGKKAEKLIRKLKNSSALGAEAAKGLQEKLDRGYNVMDDDDFYPWDIEDDFCSRYREEEEISRQPYVRETPKIGRNDPCPCGSGKKYKKCDYSGVLNSQKKYFFLL